MNPKKPSIPNYVALFWLVYLLIDLVPSILFEYIKYKPPFNINIVAILISVTIIRMIFKHRHGRKFYKQEYLEILMGSSIANLAIQCGVVLLLFGVAKLFEMWLPLILIVIAHTLLMAVGYLPWQSKRASA